MMELRELKKFFEKSWPKDTCYPKQKNEWSKGNPSIGQCAVTSLIVNDLYGGKILFNKEYNHFWNLLDDGSEIDLTRDQFGPRFSINDYSTVSRESILNTNNSLRARTPERYKLLKERVDKLLFIKSEV